ncbi:MAG: hypothetical protein ACO307_03300 [Ilumatobacteraceae bacterium]
MISKALRKWLTERRKASDWSLELETFAALALVLAGRMDDGDVSGPLAKELRATLEHLTPEEVADDIFERITAELGAPVRDGEV